MKEENSNNKLLLNSEKLNLYQINNISENNKIKQIRYNLLDNIKGILIFTVVFSHFLLNYPNKKSIINSIINYIYAFHMPGFIFCSGFLSKSINSRNIKSISKLLLIYFIFNFSHGLILYKYNHIIVKFLEPYHSYWYLLCLIYWRISVNYFSNQYFSIFISFIISILIGFIKEFNNILSLKKSFSFFPYFIVGYKLSKENLTKIIYFGNHYYIYIFLLFIIFLFFSYSSISSIEIYHSMMSNHYENYTNDIIIRIKIYIFAFLIIFFSLLLIPNKPIPFLTKTGKNTLYIYLFHRIFTIIVDKEIFQNIKYRLYIINFSLIFTIIIILIFGANIVVNGINKFINYIHNNIISESKKGKIIGLFISLVFILIQLINISFEIEKGKLIENNKIQSSNLSIKLINTFNEEELISISYIGDLILLKDQVIVAKNKSTGKYEFDDMFKFTSDILKKSDLSIGIYEGPSAGNNTSYSTSNYGDGIPLALNYPDEFAESVKRAGIDLVTTANNHLLDKGIFGALRTIDILNKYNICHTGSYRNQKEKQKLLIINIKGIKFAFLSYTSIINSMNLEIIYEKYPYLTGIIPDINNKYYNEIYNDIKNDFKKAKNSDADYIIVFAHMGTEFSHETNDFQKHWNKIFSDLGANIILGDHSHAVQPLELLGKTFIVNCPGNFANSYIYNDGDATSIINLYFNKNNKKFIGSSIIPMYTQEFKPKYFIALPIFKIFNQNINITSYEKIRIDIVHKLITKIMLKKEIPISEIKEKYYFINGSYYDIINEETKLTNLINEEFRDKLICKYINISNSITFIGDGLTEGNKNNFHPWYEPLIYYFKNKKIINISKGSYTTSLIIKNFKYQILKTQSDLYIIFLGMNDIILRDPKICAMSKIDYIDNIKIIVNFSKKNNKSAKFIFISPWILIDDNKLNNDKIKLMDEYGKSLEEYCQQNNYLYININKYLNEIIKKDRTKYITEKIYLNQEEGIKLFSKAILINSK